MSGDLRRTDGYRQALVDLFTIARNMGQVHRDIPSARGCLAAFGAMSELAGHPELPELEIDEEVAS